MLKRYGAHFTVHYNLLITEKFPGSDLSLRLLYVKSNISSPEAVPKPLGRELSRFTLNNAKQELHYQLKLH